MSLVKVNPPQQEIVRFTMVPGTISWSTNGNPKGASAEEARGMARKLLEAADTLDRLNKEVGV